MSKTIAAGLYHQRCKDLHTTYFEGISTPPKDSQYTRDELDELVEKNKAEAKQQYAERQAEKYDRMAKYSLDPGNKEQYQKKSGMWKNVRFKTGDMSQEEYIKSKRPLGNFRAVPQEQVVNILREDSREWIEHLTDVEKHAIRKYTYNSGDKKPNRFFERLNAMLRGELEEDKKLRNYADIISGAIKKNRMARDVIAYRSVKIDPTFGTEPGGLVVFDQFTSTSVTKEGTLRGKYHLIIYVRNGSNAAYIESISAFPKQTELLLDKGSILRVLSRKGDTIELEVL